MTPTARLPICRGDTTNDRSHARAGGLLRSAPIRSASRLACAVALPIPLPEDRDDVRLSDADRDVASEFLRHNFSEGRLTLVEMEERLEVVYAAKTGADLAGVFDDLPHSKSAARTGGPPVRESEGTRGFSEHMRVYLVVNAFMVAIWLLTGLGYFWPIWVIVPWGFAVAMHGTGSRRRPS